jgi:hypothetical protein
MTTTDINISIEIIKKQKLTKKNVRNLKNDFRSKFWTLRRPLNAFTMKKEHIYTLILGFQRCQVGRVRSIALYVRSNALMQEFLHHMGITAFERKNVRSRAHTSELAKTCEI